MDAEVKEEEEGAEQGNWARLAAEGRSGGQEEEGEALGYGVPVHLCLPASSDAM